MIIVQFFYISDRIKTINCMLQQIDLWRSRMSAGMKRDKFNGEKRLYDEKKKHKNNHYLIIVCRDDNSLREKKC